MFENKTKEMYLFSQNVFLFCFILSKIRLRWLKKLQAEKTAIFNMNI